MLSVSERGKRIATFRYVQVALMEMVARWIPLVPEMEVKCLLGGHLWTFAEQANALGRRTGELRMPEQHSLAPQEGYARWLAEAAATEGTAARLTALYDAVLPGLERRYRDYLADTDALMDAPTVVLVERILVDLARVRREAAEIRTGLGGGADAAALAAQEASFAQLVA